MLLQNTDQIKQLINKFETETGENLDREATTPATHNLFKVDLSSEKLEKQKR